MDPGLSDADEHAEPSRLRGGWCRKANGPVTASRRSQMAAWALSGYRASRVAAAGRWEAVEAMRAVIATVLEVAPDAFDVGGVAPWSARTGWPLEAGSRVRDRSRGGDIVWEARIL